MKTVFSFLIVCLLCCEGFAQNSALEFFTEEGERFHVIMNGQRYNDDASTNVFIDDLTPGAYRVKIVFTDNIDDIDRTLHLEPGLHYVMNIREHRRRPDEYVMRLISQNPVAATPKPVTETPPADRGHSGGVSITETTTHHHGSPSGESVRVKVDMGMGMGMPGGHIQVEIEESYSHTTTHTTTTGHTHAAPEPVSPVPGYSGPIGCHYPMSPADFNRAKGSISSQSFEDSKLTIAKQIATNNCMLSDQVKEIMNIFTFEETKLEFAKFAYGRTHDLGNYYIVNDAFTFSTSIDELNSYISTR